MRSIRTVQKMMISGFVKNRFFAAFSGILAVR